MRLLQFAGSFIIIIFRTFRARGVLLERIRGEPRAPMKNNFYFLPKDPSPLRRTGVAGRILEWVFLTEGGAGKLTEQTIMGIKTLYGGGVARIPVHEKNIHMEMVVAVGLRF